jgi:hypothetical protein
MFDDQANLAGAIQSYLNGNHSTLEEVAEVYKVDMETLNTTLNPPQILHTSKASIEENLPDVNQL